MDRGGGRSALALVATVVPVLDLGDEVCGFNA